MILLDTTKVNQNLQNNRQNVDIFIETYENTYNFGLLKCPNCNSTDLIRWGYYKRKAIYFKNKKVFIKTLTVQRMKCNSCNKTHGILPIGLIPYKQHGIDAIVESLIDPNEEVIEIISLDTIKKWKTQLKNISSYLITMFQDKSIISILIKIKKQIISFYKDYFQRYKQCFLQIKSLYLNLCSL